MRRTLFLLLSLAWLTCAAQVPKAVEPFRPIPTELRTRLEGLRTADIAEQRRRWGPLADLAGKPRKNPHDDWHHDEDSPKCA